MTRPIAVRRSVAFLLVFLTMLGFTYAEFFRLSAVSRAQADQDAALANREDHAPTLNAAGRGKPHFGFDDGRELMLGNGAGASLPFAMASADFDSDGFADVAVADSSGSITLLKGRDPSVFALQPNLPPSEQPKPEPFTAVPTGARLGFGPDRIFAGDFNADGKQDLLGFAAGATGFELLSGDGRGHFSAPTIMNVGGTVSAVESGEIGKPDGQADLAVALTNEKGSFVAIYEHPESAFRHPPEVIKLPSPANSIAIGNTDEDFYSDVAVSCGSKLILIHERGQVYPWDMMPESGIKRPPAIVEIRDMPAMIISMAVGRFGEKRGASLALLGGDGRIFRLEPVRKLGPTASRPASVRKMTALPFVPTGSETRNYALAAPEARVGGADPSGNPLVDYSEMRTVGKEEYFQRRAEELAKNQAKYSPEELATITGIVKEKSAAMEKDRRAAFLRSVSPRTSRLKDWAIETVASDPGLAAAANAGGQLDRVNVSDGDLDDLMVSAVGSDEIRLVSRQKNAGGGYRAEIATISAVAGATRTVLPVKLNLDALDDLLVLSDGRTAPSVVMTAPQSVIYVTSTDDSTVCNPYPDTCTLRGAILAANSSPGTDIVGFAISNSTSIIQLQSQLPVITDSISMQAGNRPDGSKYIEISGNNIPGAADGIKLRSSNNFVWGLAINGMPNTLGGGAAVGGNGITLESTSSSPNNGNNYVVGLYLGTDATGTISKPNASTGMLIFDSDNNAVGGGGIGFRNVMSGNNTGGSYGLDVTVGNSNNFQNNVIGLDATGVVKLGNTSGVFLSGAGNQFGGDNADQGNTVSGNGTPYVDQPNRCYGSGVFIASIYDAMTLEPLTLNSTLRGNRIGTDVGGTSPMGNCGAGIYTNPLHQTTIGSITETGRNIIADNGFTAIRCIDEISDISQLSQGGFCAIAGNNIGTDITGNVAMGNDDRNFLGGFYRVFGNVDLYLNLSYSYFGAPGGTTPGGACTGFCNLYSGNAIVNSATASHFNSDIYVTGFSNVAISNNLIGTNRSGTAALPNYSGVVAGSMFGDLFVGGVGDDNGTEISLGNLISGQKFTGLSVTGGFANGNCPGNGTNLLVQGNRIGTDITGMTGIPNGAGDNGSGMTSAVFIFRGYADSGSFGGSNPLARNIVSGNASDGILVSDACFASLPVNLPITNNLIGVSQSTAPLGNGGVGIRAAASFLNIGGSSPNEIAFNGAGNPTAQAGVQVTKTGNYPAVAVSIRNNSIHDNNGLGIDLGAERYEPPDGVTPNDNCGQDSDPGPNLLQNYPELMAPVFNGDGTVTVDGILKTAGPQHYFVDIYSSPVADPSEHGEGEVLIGTVNLTTDGNGFASFTFNSVAVVSPAAVISAIATDDYGNTSEFSCNAGASCSALSGYRSLDEYTVSPSEVCPASIVVNLNGDEPDANLNDGFCDIDTSNSDSHECTLRAALQIVTNPGYVGSHTIEFFIPTADRTITPSSPLPQITTSVIIDGASQNRASQTPPIELNGINAGATDGLVLGAGSDNSTIRGLAINRFLNAGVRIASANNVLTSCYIGVLADGITPDPNSRQDTGVVITGANNRIGGAASTERNILSFNRTNQVLIDTAGATNNSVLGNYIGMLANGNAGSGENGVQIANGASVNRIGDNTQRENRIGGLSTGILISRSDGNFVRSNSIEGGVWGVRIQSSSNNIVGGDDGDFPLNTLGNSIYENSEGGILIANFAEDTDPARTQNNRVYQNYIGNIQGEAAAFQQKNGVVIGMSTKNVIGGGTFVNLISGNQEAGVKLLAGAIDNEVRGNYIGIDRNGDGAFPNQIGVEINGNRNRVRNNLISGNSSVGVFLRRQDVSSSPPQENRVYLNRIGLDRTGNLAIPNAGVGVIVDGPNNQIGEASGTNWISGNSSFGVLVLKDGNQVRQNWIGTNRSGNAPVGNIAGVVVEGASDTTIDGNVVSGNRLGGIVVRSTTEHPTLCSNNIIRGNRVGTDISGFSPIPNGTVDSDGKYRTAGIQIRPGAVNTVIGGTGPERNLVSGNDGPGITVGRAQDSPSGIADPTGTRIQGNYIGTDLNGSGALGNRSSGVFIEWANDTLVGGFGGEIPAARNVISANGLSGVDLAGDGTRSNRISGNYIGTDANGVGNLGNGVGGVVFHRGAHHNIVGGTEPNAGNRIAFNLKGGVAVLGDAGCCNVVDPNSIFQNELRGISLGCQAAFPDGDEADDLDVCSLVALPNDPGDADTGGNNLQNYPEITDVTVNGNGDLIVTYFVDSDPGDSNYGIDGLYLEFFKSDLFGQGETFLGSDHYTLADHDQMFGGRFGTVRPLTPAAGAKIVNLGNAAVLGFDPGDMLTGTATDADGNTSEFFPPFAPTAAHASIGGRVLSANGLPLRGVRLTLTDLDGNLSEVLTGTFGRYRFDNVEVGRAYVLTVKSRKYEFANPSRLIDFTDEVTDADFTASP